MDTGSISKLGRKAGVSVQIVLDHVVCILPDPTHSFQFRCDLDY